MAEKQKNLKLVFSVAITVIVALLGVLAWIIDNAILKFFGAWSVDLSVKFAWIIAVTFIVGLVILLAINIINTITK